MYKKHFIRYYFCPLILGLFAFTQLLALGQTPRPNLNRVRTFDAQHYLIKTTFDRAKKTFTGETTISFKPLVKNFRILELDSEGLRYEAVALLPNETILISRITDDKIFITLDKEYQPGDLIKVRLSYDSKPKKGVYFVDEMRRNGAVLRASQVWTQGEAAETRHWFPSYDFPDDKATTEQYITVTKGETAIANGELKSRNDNRDGTETFHYYMPLPHSTYLTSFVVGTYVKIEQEYGQIPFGFYVYPDKTHIVPKAFGKTRDMMKVFENLTKIKYPFNKYDQTIVGSFTFGGMENISATTMADTEILRADFTSSLSDVEDLVSHELAHSWFGNLVTCRNWAELWLNEGFATFMEAAFREQMYGRASYIDKINKDVKEYLAEDAYKKYPHGLFNALADEKVDDSMFDTITYQKGGAVVHMLRETVGDEAFWKGINTYLERHKFGNVESSDLQQVMEEVSHSDLDWFFSQWVYGGGYPKITVKQAYYRKNHTIEMVFSQTQKSDQLIPPAFILPIEVSIRTSSGTKIEKIRLTRREEKFTISVNEKPSEIIIDKADKIPLKILKQSGLAVR